MHVCIREEVDHLIDAGRLRLRAGGNLGGTLGVLLVLMLRVSRVCQVNDEVSRVDARVAWHSDGAKVGKYVGNRPKEHGLTLAHEHQLVEE